MNELLMEILCHLEAMNLYYHNAHNNVKGSFFFQDHAAFADYYAEAEDDYDALAERIIGLTGTVIEINEVLKKAYEKLAPISFSSFKENKELFIKGLEFEQHLQNMCNQIDKSALSSGCRQLVGDIANSSEARTYKIKQRVR